MTDLLSLQNITVRFGGLTAVDHVSFAVAKGSICGLIGPNGAGKTTLFNIMSGLVPQDHGVMILNGVHFEHQQIWQRTDLGLARTFQNIRLFSDMTVLENVMAGAHSRIHVSLRALLLRQQSWRRDEQNVKDQAFAWLDFVGLRDAAFLRAGDLSYGDQRRVEIARALMSNPTLIMLDEPAAGLNPAETKSLMQLIGSLKQQGFTILIVEHDMPLVMGLCDAITVLNFGRVIAHGTPQEVRTNPQVIEAYLGAKIAHDLASSSTLANGGVHV